MKNLSQSKSYLQSNISTKRERESRKHINDISYKFNKSIIVVLIVMMTLPLYTAMAIPPVCLSLWYNSNDVDLGYPLLSRSTICPGGGEFVDIVCADTLLVQTDLPPTVPGGSVLYYRYKIENLTSSTFYYSVPTDDYVRPTVDVLNINNSGGYSKDVKFVISR